MDNPWTTKSIQTVYDNKWIAVSHRDVITPTGTDGIYGLVHFKNIAVGVLPLDEQYNTWLVGQYRYTLEEYSWEIPEGGCPAGEDPLEAAKRELLEETGIKAQKWTPIVERMHTSNSVTDEAGIAYVAKQLSFGVAMPEDTEDLQVKKVPLEEAVQMVMNNQITDSLSMIVLLKAALLHKQGLL